MKGRNHRKGVKKYKKLEKKEKIEKKIVGKDVICQKEKNY